MSSDISGNVFQSGLTFWLVAGLNESHLLNVIKLTPVKVIFTRVNYISSWLYIYQWRYV